mmetsp:Transcript_32062/g.56290  ORF Transcript_32062/g.56290 Transcript_32062/m.56290 type:complete len:220 (-) Transcript_32062:1032-1691(-)
MYIGPCFYNNIVIFQLRVQVAQSPFQGLQPHWNSPSLTGSASHAVPIQSVVYYVGKTAAKDFLGVSENVNCVVWASFNEIVDSWIVPLINSYVDPWIHGDRYKITISIRFCHPVVQVVDQMLERTECPRKNKTKFGQLLQPDSIRSRKLVAFRWCIARVSMFDSDPFRVPQILHPPVEILRSIFGIGGVAGFLATIYGKRDGRKLMFVWTNVLWVFFVF